MIQTNDNQVQAAPGIDRSKAVAVSPSTPQSLYAKRKQIYAKLAHGNFRKLKWAALFILLGIYYFIPWIRWDRGPDAPSQAVLVDFENARFYFFFIEIWPQEVYYITGLLILAALGLFLVTALFGRVWCGYACPQTIWTDLFIAIERFFEGDRNARIKLDRAKWDFNKIWRKTAKHIVWILVAAATGGAWILYFHDAPTIFRDFLIGHAPITSYVFMGLLTFTTYTLAGYMREQVCTYMCPWPRIQAAMIDDKALNVTYRYDRGEPRGAHKKNATWEGRGDCIDCRQCVAVCPTGIDIRDGLQLECIGCALCIDACNEIMDKIDRPRGLIAYDTDANIERRQKGAKEKFELIRARTVIYAILFAAVGSFMLFGLLNRSTLDMNVQRDRIPNFVELSDGSIRNGYQIKVLNKTPQVRTLDLTLDKFQNPVLRIVGQDNPQTISVPANQTIDYKVYVALEDVSGLQVREGFNFVLEDTQTNEKVLTPSLFITGKTEK
ncbi:MAG: cytochrome c oxidase accessory protein CcoG [Acidimicrobiales bacterium]|nr:cytochrome c oxidase accessory protein CcoG [Hyphomonadaceae bacterium]RZV43952.1 MAG: cytochrome c oxidase accessory protein CcoG [Acidimicrobiales bacterium]